MNIPSDPFYVSQSGFGKKPASAEFKPGKPGLFDCPNCGGQIELRTPGHTLSAVCRHCNSLIDVTDERYVLIAKGNANTLKTLIALGARGTWKGIEWEAIGFQRKSDATSLYQWEEYLLFNPYHGFRFLVSSDRHWTWMQLIKRDIRATISADRINYNGHAYRAFTRGQTIVLHVQGEFYWRVRKGDNGHVADYICPPYLLSTEAVSGEFSVSHGEYLYPEDVQAMFGLPAILPSTGVGANQPNLIRPKARAAWTVAMIAMAAMMAAQFFTLKRMENAPVYTAHSVIPPEMKDRVFASPIFHVPSSGNLEINTQSSLTNSWAEYNFSVVNTDTKETTDITQAAEYYSGYDSDGSWTEGSRSKDSLLTGIKPGNYQLLIETDAQDFTAQKPLQFDLDVKRNVPIWSNFVLSLVLLFLYPLAMLWRSNAMESRRWANSDFAPSKDVSEDDD